MKVINKIRKMTTEKFAEFLHYELGSSSCPDCILNNLDKMSFCNGDKTMNCIKDIKTYLESEESK